jgi:SAM-dependent MidA family methyltransferase
MLIRFDEFMQAALYGPDGFYSKFGRAGRRGDFLTSPEVGPLFGAVLARATDQWWRDAGRPAEFTVVDAGAGPGTLARAVLAAKPEVLTAGALRYICVEVSAAQRQLHPAGVESSAELPKGPINGVIVANELLDNLPFRLMVFDGAWRESFVRQDHQGVWTEELRPVDLDWPDGTHGARAPLQQQAAGWVADAVARLGDGRLVVIDYAVPRTAMLAMRPWRQWLRTYKGHQPGGHYLSDVGQQDITAEVAVDQLTAAAGEPDAVRSQAQWLQLHGIADLIAEGKRIWAEQAARPGVVAMTARSRIGEAEALLDPGGLGAFSVIEWVRSAGRPVPESQPTG